ncbi:membrane lipoprotein lipid attachment site-containing protein [Xenorhabdus bovienii]|uniref:membrane lipoprotein lipid attachment site-containing protein n=1 Tax=Xenorhabdus bovienii TaxID=40576 RepID=UPI00237C52E0|nr:membrane lipoprotein lipid attachment site-containing protein [Xenorhabdus bovienii]MDE1483918.1 membrane lipoprotein lipid attachment site-containing protein [Xenorhabdus bovienii]
MKKIIVASTLALMLSGCAALEFEPPAKGKPYAVYTSNNEPTYLASCLAREWGSYDPLILHSYKSEYWGYHVNTVHFNNGESADVYRKNGKSVINFYAASDSNKKRLKERINAMMKANEFCVNANLGEAPDERDSDGKVKLW